MKFSVKTLDTVLGYVVLHRHGHRAPIRNLFDANELKFWMNLLPKSDRLQDLSNSYPIHFHFENESPIDLKYKPLSCLTDTGVDHMISVGKKTNDLFPLMNKSNNFQVFSTNYHRTQASAQSFLTGLGAPKGTSVEVRNPIDCTLSFYEGRPDIAHRLTKKVQSYEEFKQDEVASMESIGRYLAEILPTLSLVGSSSSPDGSSINWMAALDYFTCREGHNLPIDDRVLIQMKVPVINYVTRRYRAYYSDPEHRSHSVNPILTDIHRVLSTFQANWANEKIIHVPIGTVVFSGHDVNILGLLHGLNATLVDPTKEDERAHWPDFGSVLIFELVSKNDLLHVNLYYNHEPLLIGHKDLLLPSIPLEDLTSFIKEYPQQPTISS